MLKYILFLTKHEKVSSSEFDHLLGEIYVPRLIAAQRAGRVERWNTLIPDATVKVAHIADVPPPPSYDGFVEGWVQEEGQLAQLGAELRSAGVGGVSDMVDEERSYVLICEERRTSPEDLGNGPGAPDNGSSLKQVVNIQKKGGMSRDEFIAYYEGNHAPLAARTLRMWSGYQRNFLRHDLTRKLALGPVEQILSDLDVITVIRYRSADDQRSMDEMFADPAIGNMFADDEERLFNRATIQMFQVQESTVR